MGIFRKSLNDSKAFIKVGRFDVAIKIIQKHLKDELGTNSQILWFIQQQREYDKYLKLALYYCKRNNPDKAIASIQEADSKCLQMEEGVKILYDQLKRDD